MTNSDLHPRISRRGNIAYPTVWQALCFAILDPEASAEQVQQSARALAGMVLEAAGEPIPEQFSSSAGIAPATAEPAAVPPPVGAAAPSSMPHSAHEIRAQTGGPCAWCGAPTQGPSGFCSESCHDSWESS